MAIATANLAYDTSTVANYKAIMQQFGTSLSSFGWIQTADTGQVSWAGVTTLPGNGVFRDFEIWRMADASQATMPVFMKLEYSTQGTNAPQVRLTVGQGSNGSGTITGMIITNALAVTGFQSTSLGASTLFPCYYSGASGRFTMFIFGNTSAEWDWSIERSKDITGADTDEFVSVTVINNFNGNISHTWGTKTGFTGAQGRCNGFTSGTTTNNFGGTTAACPQFVLIGKVSNPLLGLCFTPAGDVGQGSTVSANVYGSTHTYLATKTSPNNAGPSTSLGYVGGAVTAVLVRFE